MLLETLCNIPAKPQEWVWKHVIPEGQLTLLMGEPGVGKSMLAMDVIARLTRGKRGLSAAEQGQPNKIRRVHFRKVGQLRQVRTHKNPTKQGTWRTRANLANFFVNQSAETP